MLHHYYAGQTVWALHWLTLDGPLAESTVAAFGLEAEIRDAGVPPVHLFLRLRQTLAHPARQNELRSSAIAFEILSRIAGSHHEHCDPVVTAAVDAMHQSWNDPVMSLKKLAADLAGVWGCRTIQGKISKY